MSKNSIRLVIFGFAFQFISTLTYGQDDKIWIESYNVENLFNPDHQEGKDDLDFTPNGKLNWTPEKLRLKLSQIRKVIELKNPKPDILGIVEIEDEVVARMLAQELGYAEFIISESPDERGVDVALLYNSSEKIKFVSKNEHILVDPTLIKPTRNILEVKFKTSAEQNLVVFVNHWPSQRSPAATRIAAAKVLKELADKRMQEDPDVRIVSFGDFNTLDKDHPHPFSNILLVPNGGSRLHDVHEEFMKSASVPRWMQLKQPLGTYFYAPTMDWNVLDRFFVNSALLSGQGLHIDLPSYEIVRHSSISTAHFYTHEGDAHFGSVVQGIPKRYDHLATAAHKAGYSDHYPIRMCLNILGQLLVNK